MIIEDFIQSERERFEDKENNCISRQKNSYVGLKNLSNRK
jgi:hypothetical protein